MPGPPDAHAGSVVVDVAGACDPSLVANCDEVRTSRGTPLRIRPMRLFFVPEAWAGLVLLRIDRNVEIADLFVSGFPVGLQIEASPCLPCTVHVHRFTIQGAGAAGVLSEAFHGRVALTEGRIETVGGGQRSTADVEGRRGSVTSNGSHAVSISDAATVRVRDLEATSARPSVLPAVEVRGVQQTEIDGLVASGFAGLIHLERGMADLRRIRSAGGIFGVDAVHATVSGEDWRIGPCEESGVRLLESSLELRGLEVRGCGEGIRASGAPELRLRNFSLARNGHGLRTDSDNDGQSVAELHDGDVGDNRFAGLELRWDRVDGTNLTIHGNGKDWPDPSRPEAGPSFFGGIVARRYLGVAGIQVTGSSFVGNAPFAFAVQPDMAVDARDNWWGSATGPVVRPDPDAGAVGLENAVSPNVVFAPFRTRP